VWPPAQGLPRSVAVMQPYAFPYLGYLALVHASERFVFYDDVAYQPRTWMNRNRLLVSGQARLFSLPVQAASQHRWICHTRLHEPTRFAANFLRTLEQAYRRAPCREQGLAYVMGVLQAGADTIGELAQASVTQACALLNIQRRFERSSSAYAHTAGAARVGRLVAIAQAAGASTYLNSPGGRALYTDDDFAPAGLELAFVDPALRPYAQTGSVATFVAGLSIIDVLMHLPPQAAAEHVADYAVVPATRQEPLARLAA
jgi:hypothetical protein